MQPRRWVKWAKKKEVLTALLDLAEKNDDEDVFLGANDKRTPVP